jgi:hypothetical protein
LLSVTAVAVVSPLKFALAPLPGVVNVTVTPDTGALPESLTVACSAVPNAVFTAVLCGVPALAVTLAGGLAMLVRLKLVGVGIPDTAAVTV